MMSFLVQSSFSPLAEPGMVHSCSLECTVNMPKFTFMCVVCVVAKRERERELSPTMIQRDLYMKTFVYTSGQSQT